MNRVRLLATVACITGLIAPTGARAQDHAIDRGGWLDAAADASTAAERLAPAPSALMLLTAEMSQEYAASDTARPPFPQVRDRRGIPLMVAGGVAFVAGAIIGGDGGTLVMVGGAVVGAYGMYVYLGGS